MEWFTDILITIAVFAAALFILVFVHELGHFLAAKAFKMRVDRFSIGFPPKIIGFTRGETEYSLGATPLGGYVKIAGMVDESMDTDFAESEPQPWEYRSKAVWKRMVVITAGVIFNMILAVLIYFGMALSYGDTVIRTDSIQGFYVEEESYAHEIGFMTNDRIIGVNGELVDNFADLFSPKALTAPQVVYMVERDGELLEIATPDDFLDRIGEGGFFDITQAIPSWIGGVAEGTPAENAGLQPGDRVQSINGTPINYWIELSETIKESEGPMALMVQRDGELLSISVEKNPETGQIGINFPAVEEFLTVDEVDFGFTGAVAQGFRGTSDTFNGIIGGLGKLFSGSISLRENLGGPVAIASLTRQATESAGLEGFWSITAFLSITLAIMNMLPIPGLDGGHFVFLLYEGITRREPSLKTRMTLQQIGFFILISLFVLITFNDILRAISG